MESFTSSYNNCRAGVWSVKEGMTPQNLLTSNLL